MFTFKVTEVATGEESEVKADSRDVYVWEKTSKTGEKYVDLLAEMSMSKYYRLALITAKRLGVVEGKTTLDDFAAAHLLEMETEEIPPTDGDPSSEM